MLRRRLERLKTYPLKVVATIRTLDPVDGSAIEADRVMWEGRASFQPLATAEAVALGRAVETQATRLFLPGGVPVPTGASIQLDRGRDWESWGVFKVEPWQNYTLVFAERQAAPHE